MKKRTSRPRPYLITEGKHAQKKEILEPHAQTLKSSSLKMHPTEAFCKTLINNLTEGVAISGGSRKVFINRALLKIYGFGHSSEASEQSLERFIHPEDRETIRTKLSLWFEGKIKMNTFEYRIVRADGAIRTLQTFPTMIAFKGEQIAVAITHDITEIKRAEEKIQHLNAKLQKLIDLCQINTGGSESVHNAVCHDLRTPLIVIERSVQKLVKDYASELDQRFVEMLDLIRTNIRWMNQLIDGLVEYGSIGKYEINRTMILVRPLVESVINMISMIYQERKIILNVGELPSAYADEKMLRRVFMNLISNAFKFTKYRETAVIEVGALEKPGETIYYVRDNGEGFDMRYRDNLFKVFQRLHSADKFEGTGVGLAIVKRIVEEHGGRVWAESVVGEGTTFFFALPGAPGKKE